MTPRRILTSAILKALGVLGPGRLPPRPDFEPRRVAVMRYGGFGDVLATTSLVRAIRRAWPETAIDFVTLPSSETLLANNPDIDRIVTGPKPRLSPDPRVIAQNVRLIRELSAPPYDIAFIAHHEFDILLLSFLFRARYRVGFDVNERGFDFAFTHSSCTYTAPHPKFAEHLASHFTVHYQRLLHAFLGRETAIERSRIEIAEKELARARRFLADRGLEKNLVVIAPGGSTPTKLWPMERYAELARRLMARHDISMMVMVGPAEAHAAALFDGIGGRFHFDAGGNSFRENMAIVKLARAMAGNDTGLMHVAAAFDLPAVSIFGPTPATIFGYADRGHRVLTADLPCIPCNAPTCALLPDGGLTSVPPCLEAIPTDRVVAEMDEILRHWGRR